MLRVLNDDKVEGGKGFGAHPHDNMEIISIPLSGGLVHEDNLGNKKVVSAGEIQVMSTGKGVFHSEYNNSPSLPAEFLQIWVFPNRLNVTPRYDQIQLDPSAEHNALQMVISPYPGVKEPLDGKKHKEKGTWIYQDAWFHLGTFNEGRDVQYSLKKKGNGIYLFVIDGAFLLDGHKLATRDGLGITDTDTINVKAVEDDSRILIMEVPMENKIL